MARVIYIYTEHYTYFCWCSPIKSFNFLTS